MNIYSLTEEEFIQLQQSGLLYKLYPSLKGVLVNVEQFKEKKRTKAVNDALFNFCFDIMEMSGIDPEELLELIQKHQEVIAFFIENKDQWDVMEIIDMLREGGEEE